MTSKDFCYWLQGHLEIGKTKEINAEQLEVVKKHLNLVFVHEIDPSMGNQAHQNLLNSIHGNMEEGMRC